MSETFVGSSSGIEFKSLPIDDPHQRQPDVTLATQLLSGWRPAVDLRQGLAKTIDYFRQQLAVRQERLAEN